VPENRVLRRIFGRKRNQVRGGWRKLHNEELHKLYSPLSIIRLIKSRRMRLGRACSTNGETNAYRIMVVKPDGNRPLGRSRRRWVDNIKMNLRELEWDGMDWIDPAQDRALVNTVMNLRVP
jgi:hypothetical protein